jgi:hypothetical protein
MAMVLATDRTPTRDDVHRERRAQLVRYFELLATDSDAAHEIYRDDAVLEFPQSGERFEGLANFREWRRQYPKEVAFRVRNLRGDGDLWVAEILISYEGGPEQPGVAIFEFRGDRATRETVYVTEPWEAPDWRAGWRAAP